MWFPHMGGWEWGWMAMGWVWMFIFWGGIIALAVWVVKRLTQPREGGQAPDRVSPLEIAKDRYARGEITREQFEQLRKDLQ